MFYLDNAHVEARLLCQLFPDVARRFRCRRERRLESLQLFGFDRRTWSSSFGTATSSTRRLPVCDASIAARLVFAARRLLVVVIVIIRTGTSHRCRIIATTRRRIETAVVDTVRPFRFNDDVTSATIFDFRTLLPVADRRRQTRRGTDRAVSANVTAVPCRRGHRRKRKCYGIT